MLNNVKESVDKDGNITLSGSTFQNPHVVAALVGTKSVTCETRAIGEELQFTIKLGITKSIHDVKPTAPAPNTVTVPENPPQPAGEKDIVHPATLEPVIAPSEDTRST